VEVSPGYRSDRISAYKSNFEEKNSIKRESLFWKQEHNHKSEIKSPDIRIKSTQKRDRVDEIIINNKLQKEIKSKPKIHYFIKETWETVRKG
jgi:hypothetical protein